MSQTRGPQTFWMLGQIRDLIRVHGLEYFVLRKNPSYSSTLPHNPTNPQINLTLLITLFLLFALPTLTLLHIQ